MRRKYKIIINSLLSLCVFLVLMMFNGYYPGKTALQLRFSQYQSQVELVWFENESNTVLMYSEDEIQQFQSKRFLGFIHLFNKSYHPLESNKFMDQMGRYWFEGAQEMEVFNIGNGLGPEDYYSLMESTSHQFGNHKYLSVSYGPELKVLKDVEDNWYWIGEDGYYALDEMDAMPSDLLWIDNNHKVKAITIHNKIINRFFAQAHTRHGFIGINNDFENTEAVVAAGYQPLGQFKRTLEQSPNDWSLESYYYNGENVIIGTDFMLEVGSQPTAPTLYYKLHPLIQKAFLEYILPQL